MANKKNFTQPLIEKLQENTMIHLEHLNLIVKDMSESLNFYQAAFPHWQIRGGGKSEWYGHPRNWLHFGDDYTYLSLNDNGTGNNKDLKRYQIGLAHFAFVCQDLKGLIERLFNAGFLPSIDFTGDENRGSVYFVDPSGYEVEFVCYLKDNPSLRNIYD